VTSPSRNLFTSAREIARKGCWAGVVGVWSHPRVGTWQEIRRCSDLVTSVWELGASQEIRSCSDQVGGLGVAGILGPGASPGTRTGLAACPRPPSEYLSCWWSELVASVPIRRERFFVAY